MSQDPSPQMAPVNAHSADPTPTVCPRCDGCGQLANTDDREPWSAWADLPIGSDLAVRLGLVKPVPCDLCTPTQIEVTQ